VALALGIADIDKGLALLHRGAHHQHIDTAQCRFSRRDRAPAFTGHAEVGFVQKIGPIGRRNSAHGSITASSHFDAAHPFPDRQHADHTCHRFDLVAQAQHEAGTAHDAAQTRTAQSACNPSRR